MRSLHDHGQTGAAAGHAVADGDIVQCKILAANRRTYALFPLLYFADVAKAGDDSCKHSCIFAGIALALLLQAFLQAMAPAIVQAIAQALGLAVSCLK